jgi:hypothetical protein
LTLTPQRCQSRGAGRGSRRLPAHRVGAPP